jgi:hypothetical protein
MSFRPFFSICCLLAALAPVSLRATLEWETLRVVQRATLGQESAEGRFAFRNTGGAPVTITGISSSCGCTVPALEKRTYAPGEAGEIVAKFTFGGRLGRQVKTVVVHTDEPGARPVVLTLDVEIPEVISARPLFLLWRRGDELAAKSVAVRVMDVGSVDDLDVYLPDQRFTAELQPTGDPGEYRLVVTPRSTDVAANAAIRLTARAGGGARQVTIIAEVR